VTLSADNHRQLFVPAGFAHGFVVTGDRATVCYKCDAYYQPGDEVTVRWDDPDLGIAWPLTTPTLSGKDLAGLRLRDIPRERLPRFKG
jgi:dTDP-4-dehydrorhamnose 3,5-epimerase